jgi:hypothetical protein
MRGLREERLEKGLLAYAGGAASADAAAIAGIDRHSFLNRALERGITVLDDSPADLVQDLSRAATLLNDERLAAAVAALSVQLLDQ